MVRQPVGVVAAITPFNFPAMIPLWFLPYAIACGNTFILKPSEQDPRPAVLIVEIVDSVEEIPAGVVNLVHGGRDAVTRDPRGPGDRRGLVRRPGLDGADHRPGRGGERQAGPGARRRQELARRDARRRPRPGDAGDHGLRLRRRRPALPGRLGLRRRSATRTRRAEVREALVAAASELASAAARTRRPTSARWSRPRRASGSRRRSSGREGEAPSSCSTAAATPARPGRCWARRSSPHDPESELAREELFGPLLTVVEAPTSTPPSSSSTAPATATPARSSPHRARPPAATATAPRRGCSASTSASPPRSPGSRSPAGRTRCDGDLHANGTDAVDFYTRKKVVTSRW